VRGLDEIDEYWLLQLKEYEKLFKVKK